MELDFDLWGIAETHAKNMTLCKDMHVSRTWKEAYRPSGNPFRDLESALRAAFLQHRRLCLQHLTIPSDPIRRYRFGELKIAGVFPSHDLTRNFRRPGPRRRVSLLSITGAAWVIERDVHQAIGPLDSLLSGCCDTRALRLRRSSIRDTDRTQTPPSS